MRILITGAGGLLGSAAAAVLPDLGFDVHTCTRAQLDITDEPSVTRELERVRPQAVLNCAAYTRVDDAEREEEQARHINAQGTAVLAMACAAIDARLIYPSTDYVFAGEAGRSYQPDDVPSPGNAYGRSKAAGEAAARTVPGYLIVRTSWLFGGGGANFVRTIAQRVQENQRTRVVQDQTGRPTYARDAATAIAKLLLAEAPDGTYHIANTGATTWYAFARAIAEHFGKADLITPCNTDDYPRPARRPPHAVLDTTATDALIGELRPWREALQAALEAGDF